MAKMADQEEVVMAKAQDLAVMASLPRATAAMAEAQEM
jgi:hypothetical protein